MRCAVGVADAFHLWAPGSAIHPGEDALLLLQTSERFKAINPPDHRHLVRRAAGWAVKWPSQLPIELVVGETLRPDKRMRAGRSSPSTGEWAGEAGRRSLSNCARRLLSSESILQRGRGHDLLFRCVKQRPADDGIMMVKAENIFLPITCVHLAETSRTGRGHADSFTYSSWSGQRSASVKRLTLFAIPTTKLLCTTATCIRSPSPKNRRPEGKYWAGRGRCDVISSRMILLNTG